MKLIRDRLANAPWEFMPEGKQFVRRVRSAEEHADALRRKLLEEAREVITAENTEELAMELADLMEVINAIAITNSIPLDQLEHLRLVKYRDRGGFEIGTIWDI